MNSEKKIPCIRRDELLSWADWLAGRRARRETGNRVAPEVIRRKAGSKDKRLRALYDGERGLPFVVTDKL